MNRYRVTGYDKARKKLFSEDVEAADEGGAKLTAMAKQRRTPEGSVKANRTEFFEVELTWRDPG